LNIKEGSEILIQMDIAVFKHRIFRLIFWFPEITWVNTSQTLDEICVEFLSSVKLMFVWELSSAAANVSVCPLFESSFDLFDSSAGVIAVVSFVVKEVKEFVVFVIWSSWSGIVDVHRIWWMFIGIISELRLFSANIVNSVITSTSWSRGSDAELIRQLPRHEGPNNCQTRSHHRSSARCGRSDKESQPRVLVLPRETYQSRRGFPQSRTDVDTQGEKHHAHRAQNPLRRLRWRNEPSP
jgi:hypothetical protein